MCTFLNHYLNNGAIVFETKLIKLEIAINTSGPLVIAYFKMLESFFHILFLSSESKALCNPESLSSNSSFSSLFKISLGKLFMFFIVLFKLIFISLYTLEDNVLLILKVVFLVDEPVPAASFKSPL